MPAAAPLELWLLRHGATAWARSGRHTGRTDLPLLPEGEEEARALEPLLARYRFTAVLVSPLQRALRTCELAGLAGQASPCDDLQEWDYGAYEGITTAEIRRSVPGWTVWSHPCPEGETLEAVEQRCRRVIAQAVALAAAPISAGANPGPAAAPTRVALFAHGHLLRSLAGTWLGLGAAGGSVLALDTACIGVLGQEREQRVILRWNAPVQWP
ncbi:histidine phosphatase family protein [Synechococcus sp. CBW1006]|uniref:histidine phosphatase family protein n=1 Tax=Synechococcus sp. CBW1006 TaxID=1353138 RepID=UPI001E3AE39C|nr:histidine phosphatase family protein [Synechococcus sp. CBW1006]